MQQQNGVMRVSWICLAVVSVGVLGFGLSVMVAPPSGGDGRLYRADGLASFGLGVFGLVLTVIPFRRRERWAWSALWFYPVLWLAHLVFGLPPGTDHVHQVVFVVLSLVGLLLPVREFFPGKYAVIEVLALLGFVLDSFAVAAAARRCSWCSRPG